MKQLKLKSEMWRSSKMVKNKGMMSFIRKLVDGIRLIMAGIMFNVVPFAFFDVITIEEAIAATAISVLTTVMTTLI